MCLVIMESDREIKIVIFYKFMCIFLIEMQILLVSFDKIN